MSFEGGFERGGVQIEHVARRTEINSSRYKGKQEGLHGLLGQTKTKRRRGSKAVALRLNSNTETEFRPSNKKSDSMPDGPS
jgi:hypothetical protein